MLDTLANHNADIKRLIDKGYAVSLENNYLVIRDIPYLDNNKELQIGAFISKLEFIDNHRVRQKDHVIFFCGTHPCQLNGTPIANLGGGPTNLGMTSKDLVVQRTFSNKPKEGFADLFEKIESYMTIISGPAIELHGANPFTYRTVEEVNDSVFKFRDTQTSRSELGDLNLKFKDEVIAIIGLGGTGSYLLDFLTKTPVKEIRGFDLDYFYVHNAFRSPGKQETDDFGTRKAEIYQKRYESFRHGVNIKSTFILPDSEEELQGVTFAFICVDKGSSREGIIELLIRLKIPFIDVGMGFDKNEDSISGTLRTTYFPSEFAQDMLEKKLVPLTDLPDEIYRNNIQISELNALNACMAIIKFKQTRGFYTNNTNHNHLLFTIDNLKSYGE